MNQVEKLVLKIYLFTYSEIKKRGSKKQGVWKKKKKKIKVNLLEGDSIYVDINNSFLISLTGIYYVFYI